MHNTNQTIFLHFFIQLQLIGEDGTIYADIMIFNQPPVDPDKIHGIENIVQYASIDLTKLNKE